MIAHPAGYFKGMNEKRMDEVLEALPLDGIECAHPSVPEEYTAFYRAYCKKHGLLSSGGTDCHEDPPHAYLQLSEGRDMAWHKDIFRKSRENHVPRLILGGKDVN